MFRLLRAFLYSVVLFVVVLLWTVSAYPVTSGASTSSACKKNKKACAALVKKTAKVSAKARAARAARVEAAIQARKKYLRNDKELAISQGQNEFIYDTALNVLGKRKGTILITNVATQRVEASVYQDVTYYREFYPCSTIKLSTALAGLSEGVIDEQGKIVDPVKIYPKEWTLDESIRKSNNGYFMEVGAKVGGPDFLEVLRKNGYGSKTGLNVPGQSSGRIPSVVTDPKEYSYASHIQATALQLNQIALGIANSRTKDAFGFPKETLQRLIPGMIRAAEDGTAHLSKSKEFDLKLAGKTGTCKSTGLFTGFAPHDNPKFAITVILQGSKGKYAAKVAGEVLKVLKDKRMLDSAPLLAKG